jgi:hypothetical protein
MNFLNCSVGNWPQSLFKLSLMGGLYCPPRFQLESSGNWAIPGHLEESILAEGPAKLVKQFSWNFEWNSNSTRMQELPSTELHWDRIRGMCLVLNVVQIKCQCLLMLNLSIINKQTHSSSTTTTTLEDVHPCHHCLITTATSSSHQSPPASIPFRQPQPPQHE